MAKQYTFKTTRYTEYIEKILDNLPNKDRSEFLRRIITTGLKAEGMYNGEVTPASVLCPYFVQYQKQVLPMCNISETKETPVQDIGDTHETPTSDLGESKVTPTSDESMTLEPPEFTIEEVTEDIDLDSKLNSLY